MFKRKDHGCLPRFEFVDAAEVVRFNDDGSFNDEVTNTLLSERLQDCKTAVIPGFYGAKKDWNDRNFFKRRIRYYGISCSFGSTGGSV